MSRHAKRNNEHSNLHATDSVLKVELFYTPYCEHCKQTQARLMELAKELPLNIEANNILDAIDRAVQLGIARTPSLVVQGQHVLDGNMSKTRLKRILQQYL